MRTLLDGSEPIIYLPRKLRKDDPRPETVLRIIRAIHAEIEAGTVRTREDVKQWALPRGCSFDFLTRNSVHHVTFAELNQQSNGVTDVTLTYTVREGR